MKASKSVQKRTVFLFVACEYTGMAEILLGVLAKQLAFMTTDRALNYSFGSRNPRSIHTS